METSKNKEIVLKVPDKHENNIENQSLVEVIKPQNRSNDKENVWQVSNLEKYHANGKFSISPITVFSASDALNNVSALTSGIDTSSFIVLRDENENQANFFPNITTTGTTSDQITNRSTLQSTKTSSSVGFSRPCVDCCFCNPTLHHKSGVDSPKKCNFCTSRHQSTHTTPANSSRFQQNHTATTNTNVDTSARSSTAPTERIYECKYRSNHTHIRTHSRESDTVNTQCTKKTNKKIRKTIFNGSDDALNGNVNENGLKNGKEQEMNGNKPSSTASTKKKSTIPKLPPTTYHEWTSNSMDTTTSPSCSSVSTGSSSKSRRQNSKSVPNLPKAERTYQSNETNGKSTPGKRTNSRYQEFYGNNADEQKNSVVASELKSKQKPTGIWIKTSVNRTFIHPFHHDVAFTNCFV